MVAMRVDRKVAWMAASSEQKTAVRWDAQWVAHSAARTAAATVAAKETMSAETTAECLAALMVGNSVDPMGQRRAVSLAETMAERTVWQLAVELAA